MITLGLEFPNAQEADNEEDEIGGRMFTLSLEGAFKKASGIAAAKGASPVDSPVAAVNGS